MSLPMQFLVNLTRVHEILKAVKKPNTGERDAKIEHKFMVLVYRGKKSSKRKRE